MTSGKGYREGAGTWSQLQVRTYQCNECLQISIEWPLVDWRAWNDSALWGQLLDMHYWTSTWFGIPEQGDKSRAITLVTHSPERNSTILL